MTSRPPEALGVWGLCSRDQNSAGGKGQVMEDPTSSHLAQGSAWKEVTEPQHPGQKQGFVRNPVLNTDPPYRPQSCPFPGD